ncbi:MAG: hypothetical protein ACD_72C00243G0002 [uncultured bacterium]|nr:MAG: hypothetical protein ACD_72C00243G0002 [uncultured bacterium]
MKKVMVFGTFDIIHPGHKYFLKEAKELGDYLVVVIARDQTVQTVKHKKPKNSEEKRLKNLDDLRIANKSVLGNIQDKYQIIREENPDIIALGYDQQMFTANLEKFFLNTKIVRLKSFKPDIYKSSKLRKD